MEVKLIVVEGRPRGKSLSFPPGEFVFGRGPECHVRPDFSSVSRQHCLLRVDRDAVHLRDLGSTNGTLVNGSPVVGERRLMDGDLLQLGPLVLQLGLSQSLADTATDHLPCSATDSDKPLTPPQT